jgi:hypothetical protein
MVVTIKKDTTLSHDHGDQPVQPDDSPDAASSVANISVLSGSPVTLWCADQMVETGLESRLHLSPERPIIIGRQEGSQIEYLHPAFSPTTHVPGTKQTVLRTDGSGDDKFVSRGHFMLRAFAGGILFVNGVPSREGGIRPPKNGTMLVDPARRDFAPGEQYMIEKGGAIVIGLPNHSEIRIQAG